MSPLSQHRCLAGHRSAPKLPKAAIKTLRHKFPGAGIGDVEIEKRDHGLYVYEAEIRRNGKKVDVQVSATGTLVKIKTHIPAKDLPAAVTRALERIAGGARVRESEKVETFARLRHGEMTPLSEPVVNYEIALRSAGKGKREVRISPSGRILAAHAKDDDNLQNDARDDDEVEHDGRDDKDNHSDRDGDEEDDD